MADLKKVLKDEKIQNVRLSSPLCLAKTTPLREAIKVMRDDRKGYVIVVEGKRVIGIVTERADVTNEVEL